MISNFSIKLPLFADPNQGLKVMDRRLKFLGEDLAKSPNLQDAKRIQERIENITQHRDFYRAHAALISPQNRN
jgi:hypothetical protein